MSEIKYIHPVTQDKRFPIIDEFRGFAVFLMVIFHFSYDLSMFGWVTINFQKDLFWWTFPRVIVFFFLLSMGMSTPLSQKIEINWKSFGKRFGKIAFFALGISLVTYIMFPDKWIYFGTLHCIATASLAVLPLRNRPLISLILGSAIILPAVIFKINLPWFELPHKSMDYIPLFPWVGVVLWGIFATHKNWHLKSLPLNKFTRFLQLLGKHSLKIYILHQPIMYSVLYGIHYLSQ